MNVKAPKHPKPKCYMDYLKIEQDKGKHKDEKILNESKFNQLRRRVNGSLGI